MTWNRRTWGRLFFYGTMLRCSETIHPFYFNLNVISKCDAIQAKRTQSRKIGFPKCNGNW